MNKAQRLKRLLVCKRIPGPCNPDDTYMFHPVNDFIDPLQSIAGEKDLASDSGSGLIHTVIIPDAVIALDITFRGYRNMASAECMSCFRAVTRVLIDPSECIRVIRQILCITQILVSFTGFHSNSIVSRPIKSKRFWH